MSRQTSGRSAGGWPGSPARRSPVERHVDRPAARHGRTGRRGSGTTSPSSAARQALRELDAADRDWRRGSVARLAGDPAGSSEPRQAPSRRRRTDPIDDAVEAAVVPRPRSPRPACAPELGEQAQGERLRVDARLEPRPGAGRTAAVAAARGDEVGRAGDELVVAVPQPLGQADAARHRLVQVDRRRLLVRRADLGHEAEVARVDHEQDRGDRLDRPPGAEQRDVEVVPPPADRGRRRRSASRPSSGARARAGRSGPSRRSRRSRT